MRLEASDLGTDNVFKDHGAIMTGSGDQSVSLESEDLHTVMNAWSWKMFHHESVQYKNLRICQALRASAGLLVVGFSSLFGVSQLRCNDIVTSS